MCIVVGRSRKCKQCLQNSNNGEDSLHAVALASPGMKPRTVLLLLSSLNLEQAEALNKAFAKPFNNNNFFRFSQLNCACAVRTTGITMPRSVREKMLGLVQLARTTDKAKALAHGTIGEYEYPSEIDTSLFEFLNMNGSDFLEVVKVAKSDADIEGYTKSFVAKKSPDEIASFNRRCMTSVPKGESLEHFTALRTRIAPDRTDITTWPDLLDLDEGRSVAKREPAKT